MIALALAALVAAAPAAAEASVPVSRQPAAKQPTAQRVKPSVAQGDGERRDAVDRNTAELADLMKLPGVGPKRAQAILDRRDRSRFTRVTQLLEVKGIGKKTLTRLKPFLRVAPTAPSAASAPTAPTAKRQAPGSEHRQAAQVH